MNGRPKLPPDQQMTIEEFLAFTDSLPDEAIVLFEVLS